MQQPLAELGLQAPDLLADGGLGDPQPFRGAGGGSSATATKYARCRSSISNRLFAVRAHLIRSRAALAAASEMAAQLTSTDCAA